MRTSKHTVFLVISLLLLCCYVQECQQLALLTMMANSIQTSMMAAASSVLATTSSIGLNMIQSMLQNFVSTVHLGFSTLHTMTLSLISGFIMGNMALAGFIFFLLAVVPAEERRSIGGSSVFRPLLPFHPRTNYNVSSYPTDYRGIPILNYDATSSTNSSSIIIRRNKRALVNNATTGEKFTLPNHLVQELNNSTERIPKFLNRLVQNDPLNCLPLLMCGLSASRKPSERTEVLNDYAYLLREFLRPEDESPEDQESAELAENDTSDEDGKKKKNKQDRLRSPLKMLNQLVQGGLTGKKRDEVDKIIDKMKRDEEDQLEEEVLTQLSEDPSDLKFALEDMKVRGLKKTISKMPAKSKTKYLSKLLGNESEEEDDVEVVDDHDPDMSKALLGRFEPPQKFEEEESESLERYLPRRRPGPYPMYLSPKDLTRGAFQPPPNAPPAPDYEMQEDELYKRNYNLLEKNLGEMPGGFMKRRGSYQPSGPGPRPPSHMFGWRRGREVRHAASQRAVIQKKRGEAAEADNVYDKSRVAAEVGQVTKSNRQCRALFNECPVTSITRPIAQITSEGGLGNIGGLGNGEGGGGGGPPFLNRAVNNIRRVLLGSPSGGESSKTKRVNEIKQAIQELHPPARAGAGSEVKVVLNIGPSAPPPVDVNRSGGIPAGAPVYNPPSPYSQPQQPMHNGMHSNMLPHNMQRYPQMGMHPQSMSPHMTMPHSHGMMSPQMGMPPHSHMGMPSHMGMMHSHEMMSPQMGMPPHMGMMQSNEMMSPQMGMPSHMGMMQSHEMMSPQMGMPSHMGMMQSHEMMSPQMGMPSHMGMSGQRTTPYNGMVHPNNMLPPPKTTPTGFSTELKYRVSTKKPTMYATKRPQVTTPKPSVETTKKPIVYRNPSSSPASKKTTTTQASIKFDELEEYLKTTMAPDSEEATTETPEHTTVVTLNTFSDIVMSMEQDEPSVEDDIVVPTKFPTKDEYAQNLRETFQIFDRFKEAHNEAQNEPQVVTIARATVKPKTTTRKPSNQPKESEKKKIVKSKPSGVKGEQADIELGDEKDGKQEDLGSILSWFKKFANRGRPHKNSHKKKKAEKKAKKKANKGKGKGKKKDKEESSEESSEEDHHHHPGPLVAVPPPHLRKQIHWRAGTTIVKDGVYHLLFGKRVTKPIPPLPAHHPQHHANKPSKHDVHYESHEHPDDDIADSEDPHHDADDNPHHDADDNPHHDADDNPHHDTDDNPHHDSDDNPHHDNDDHDHDPQDEDVNDNEEEHPDDIPENDAELANYFHRLRTSESVEEEIQPPPPSYFDQQEDLPVRKQQRPDTSELFSDSENYSSSKQKHSEQNKRKKLREPHPIPKPDPPMSYEDLASEEEDDGLPPIPKLPPPPPKLPPLLFRKKKKPTVDSRSIESSYEEEGENDDDGFSAGEPKKHPLAFSPFSLVRNGNKIKLKSATYTRDTGVGGSSGKRGGSKKKKGRGENEKGKKGTSSGSSKGKNLMKRTNGYKIRLKSRPAVMNKTSAISTTTVKPKRKVLKYKNG